MLTLNKPVRPWLADPKRDPLRYDECCFACLSLDILIAKECHGVREGLECYSWDEWTIKTTYSDVRKAKEHGCPTCTILYSSLSTFFPALPWDDEDEPFWMDIKDGNLCWAYDRHTGGMSVIIFSMPDNPSPWPTLGTQMSIFGQGHTWIGGSVRHVPVDAGQGECLQLVKDWLNDCSKNHEVCISVAKAPLPKRVIHVGTSSTYNDIRLVESCPENKSYVALSHCWGKSSHLITKRSSISDHKTNISWNSFPKTFRDAICLTRYIGISYIWIDSLCIVQDDSEDWLVESAKMSTIYQGANLVISATCSSDGDGGCFTKREKTHTISGIDSNGIAFEIFARRSLSHRTFRWCDDVSKVDQRSGKPLETSDDPLLSRAWCFQERLLATRIVHFTHAEIVWECLACTRCECSSMSNYCGDPTLRTRRIASGIPNLNVPSGDDETRWLGVMKEEYGEPNSKDSSREEWQRRSDHLLQGDRIHRRNDDAVFLLEKFRLGDKDPIAKLFRHCRQVVLEYSDRDLTYDQDTLPALSGLARTWARQELGRYLAGHWENDLLETMMWVARGPERKKTDEYLAPSWSWASTRRSIDWIQRDGNYMDYHTKILDVKCQPAGFDPYARVSSGHCKVIGPLVKLDILDEPSEEKSGFWSVSANWGANLGVRRVFIDRPAKCKTVLDQLWCLRFCTVCYGDVQTRQFHSSYEKALVLRKIKGIEFERFGFLECSPDTWTGDEPLMECLIL